MVQGDSRESSLLALFLYCEQVATYKEPLGCEIKYLLPKPPFPWLSGIVAHGD